MTLCGFMQEYKDELNPVFKEYNKNTNPLTVINDLGRFYYQKLEESAMIMPEIYQHRIQRTLGI